MHQLISGHLFGGVQRLLPWLNSLIVLLLAYSLAGVSWRLWEAYGGSAAMPPLISAQPTTSATGTSGGGQGLDQVAALHLFGEASKTPVVKPVQNTIDAPETRLRLTLRGIVAVSASGEGRALIAEGAAEEKVYKTGDAIPGGAVLHEVQTDRVILQRAGRLETLTLPRPKSTAGSSARPGSPQDASASAPAHGGHSSLPSGVAEQLRSLRESVAAEPQRAFDLVQAQPVMEGGVMKGYRVNPGKERRLFQRAGLRAGDVVTSVNGIPLGDTSQMVSLFEQFKSADRFDLMVERGGRQTSLTIDLGQ